MLRKQKHIPTPEEVVAELPLPLTLEKLKAERDREIRGVLSGQSEKMLIIVGPCSAHDEQATIEYLSRLGKLNEQVKDKLVLLPRVYTNKPRTKGVGYQGMFFQPDPNGEVDIEKGILSARKLHLAAMEVSGLTAADEMLYPENTAYLEDLLAYYAVGARSVENPLHRKMASGVDMPVGMKNPMSGNLTALIQSISAAQRPQVFEYRGAQVASSGNLFAHAILRGGVDQEGKDIPNYHYESVMRCLELYKESELKNPAVIIDCNHSNSGKQCRKQLAAASEVMQNRSRDGQFKSLVKGLMIESFLVEGNQAKDGVFGQSITDPCIGWADTERLLFTLAEQA